MAATTRFAVVNNVNTARSRFADFDLHVEGCPALKKIAPEDIEIFEAKDAAAAEAANNQGMIDGGFDEGTEFGHRRHSCVKGSAAKSGATGPRYTDAQIKKGLAARKAGKTNAEVAAAAGVKSPSYFAKTLKGIAGDQPREKATTKEQIAADSAPKTRSTGRRGRGDNGGGSKRKPAAKKPAKKDRTLEVTGGAFSGEAVLKAAAEAAKPAKKATTPKTSAGPADLAARFNFKKGSK